MDVKFCVTLFCFLEIMSCILGVWGTCGVIWDVEFLVQVCVFASGFRWVGWLSIVLCIKNLDKNARLICRFVA